MSQEKILKLLAKQKTAFPSEISKDTSLSLSRIEKLLSNMSNTGLVKTISVGEGLYVLPEMSNVLYETSAGENIAKNLSQSIEKVRKATLRMQMTLKENLSRHFNKSSEELSSEIVSAVREVVEKPIFDMFNRLAYELSKSISLHEKRILSELRVLEAPINVLSSQVEKSSKEINVKLENKINECSEKISSQLPEFKEQLKELLNRRIADTFKKEEAYRLVSFERLEASEAKIRDIILEVGQILERILVVFEKTLEELKFSMTKSIKEIISNFSNQSVGKQLGIVKEEIKEVVSKLNEQIEEMINKYISQIDVDLRFITEDFHKQTSKMEKRVAEDYEDLKKHLKARFEEYPKFLRSLADFMISKALEQIDEWINEFKSTLASWMEDVINFTNREFMRLKNITISTNKRIIQEFSKYVEEMKDIINIFVKERELKFANEIVTLTLGEIKRRATEISKPLLDPIKKVIDKNLPYLRDASAIAEYSVKGAAQIEKLLTDVNNRISQLTSSRDTWITEEVEAIKLIRKILSLNIPWKINVILPSCKLLNEVLADVSATPEINIYCYDEEILVRAPRNVRIIKTRFKNVIALESEVLSMFLVPVGDKAAGIATTNNIFRIMLNILIKNILTTFERV